MDNPLVALPISILLILISTAFGRRLLAILKVQTETPLEGSVFGIGLGFGALAYLVLAVGLAGWLYSWVLLALIGVIALVSLREIGGVVRDVVKGLRSRAGAKLGAAESLIAFSMVSLGALALISALAPPSELDWDGLAYHLAVPKMYLAQHSIFYIPFMSHSNFPFLTEMLYTVGLSLGSITVAKLFHFSTYIASAAAIYSLCRRRLSPRIGSIGALLFMSVPVVIWEAGSAYADITTALYVVLAVYAVLNWEQSERRPWLVVCGLMCGFALGTKVLAAVPAAAICLWILAVSGSSRGWGRGLRASLLVGVVAILVGCPWYIKSCVYTGNPVYPFLYSVFGGKYWSVEAAEAYRGAQLAFGMGRGLREFIMLPWNLTMNGAFFFDDPSRLKLFSLIGAAFIGLIPLQILAGSRNKVVLITGLVSVVFIAAWFGLMQQTRYLITIVPLLCVVAACGVDTANSRWPVARHAANGFVAVCVVLSMATGFALAIGGARAAMGLEPRDEYLSRTLDVYDAESFINEYTPANARVVLFDEVRGFYLDRDYMWGNPGHHEIIPWSSFKTGADMAKYFRGAGYTHALVNWKFAKLADDDLLHKLIAGCHAEKLIDEVYASNGVSVYEFGEI